MMRTASFFCSSSIALAAALACGHASAQTAYTATLAGHAVLPAQSFVAAPRDASADLQASGKLTSGKRVEALGTVEGL